MYEIAAYWSAQDVLTTMEVTTTKYLCHKIIIKKLNKFGNSIFLLATHAFFSIIINVN